MTHPSTLVIIPTYNELENLPLITGRVRAAAPQVDILIVDDNSPDGTGEKAEELAEAEKQIHVLHRKKKDGLLGAYLAGFAWGLERDYDILCEMDADGSHAPEELHRLLDQIKDGADMVIGSRYVRGGEVVDWPRDRFILSKGGNLYISVALGTGLTDMTAGYRAICREVLEGIDLAALSDAGYIFQVDLAYRAVQAGFDVREVPITFTERAIGESKLDGSFVKDSLVEVTKWGVKHHGTQAVELTGELTKLARYELQRSPLAGLGGKAKNAKTFLADLAGEMGKLARYELQRSPLKNVGSQVSQTAENTRNLGEELVKITDFEIKRKSRS